MSDSVALPAVHREAEPEVRIVVEIRARGDDPVDESGLDERNERRHAEPGGSQRAGERESDGDVGLEHLLGEELRSLAQARGVVGEEGALDQIDDALLSVNASRIDPLAAQKAALLVRCVRCTGALALLGRLLLLRLRAGGGWPSRRCLVPSSWPLLRIPLVLR